MNVSLLELAKKGDLYSCSNFENIEGEVNDFLVSRDDDIEESLRKARNLAEIVLQGKSIATALQEHCGALDELAWQDFTKTQQELYNLWRAGCPMPTDMPWTSDNAHIFSERSDDHGDISEGRVPKRPRIEEDGGEQPILRSTIIALANLFRFEGIEKDQVNADHVKYFRSAYRELLPLLDAMTTIVQLKTGIDATQGDVLIRRRESELSASRSTLDVLEKKRNVIQARLEEGLKDLNRFIAIVRHRVIWVEESLGHTKTDDKIVNETAHENSKEKPEEEIVVCTKVDVGIQADDIIVPSQQAEVCTNLQSSFQDDHIAREDEEIFDQGFVDELANLEGQLPSTSTIEEEANADKNQFTPALHSTMDVMNPDSHRGDAEKSAASIEGTGRRPPSSFASQFTNEQEFTPFHGVQSRANSVESRFMAPHNSAFRNNTLAGPQVGPSTTMTTDSFPDRAKPNTRPRSVMGQYFDPDAWMTEKNP